MTRQSSLTEAQDAQPNTGLALTESKALEMVREVFGELTEADREAVEASMDTVEQTLAFARIRQKPSEDGGGILGALAFNDGREDVPTPTELLIIYPRIARVMWPKGYEAGQTLLCKSDDGVTPRADIEEPPATLCAECPCARWPSREEQREGKRRPDCNETRNILVITPTMDEPPFVFAVHGTALKPTLQYLRGLQRTLRKQGLPGFFAVRSLFDTKFEKGERGDYYVPRWSIAGPTDAAVYAKLAGDLRGYMDVMQATVEAASDAAMYGEPNGDDESDDEG